MRKVRPAVQPVHQHLHLALRLGIGGGVVILAIANLWLLARSHHDLRDAILRFRHVKLRPVRRVKIRHILIGDGNFRHDFAVHQFFGGKLPLQALLQIIYGQPAFLQLPLKLFFRVRALHFRKFVFYFAVARLQIQFLGALQQNLIVDQLIQHIQFER